MNSLQPSAGTRQYDVEADWQLNHICNMRCQYCFNTTNTTKESRSATDPVRCLEFFNSTKKVWSLHLTGGEPFLSSGFVELCKVLSSDHFLSLNSNLSSALVSDFAETIDSSRVEYVQCCLHLEERDRLNIWSGLENNLGALCSNGFLVFASQVMTPEAFARFPAAAERLADLGVVLIPKSLQGLFKGRWYPHAYSEKQRVLFRALSEAAEASLRFLTPRLIHKAVTVNPLQDRKFLNGFPVFRSAGCAAGTKFFTIQPNGNIYRCGRNQLLGNIEKGWFMPLSAISPCNSSYYPYFCLRYCELPQRTSAIMPLCLEEPPSFCTQTMHGLLRKGRQMLKQALR